MNKVKIFGKELIDEKSITQIENCMTEDCIAVLTADAHYGYGHPIGGAIAYKDKISVSGNGFDIGCGNKAVQTDLLAKDVDVSNIMDEILKQETIKSAVYAIGALQVESLKERLADLKDSDPNMKVRQAAIEALNMFEGNG